MLPQNYFLPCQKLSMLLFFILFCGKALQAQDTQLLPKNVKIIEEHALNEGFYLFEAKNYRLVPSFNPRDVIKRYSDRLFVIKINDENLKQFSKKGTFYKVSKEWKLGPNLQTKTPEGVDIYSIHATDAEQFRNRREFKILNEYGNFLVVKASAEEFQNLLEHDLITHISLYRKPEKEAPISFHDLTVNAINLVHRRYPEVEGQGLNVSIKEQFFDTTDIDLKNRYELLGTEGETVDQHATLIATLIAGAGNSSDRSRGVARAAEVSSTSFLDLFPHDREFYLGNDIYVENHSYGTAPEQEYGNEAAAFDQSVNKVPELVHVFSSGNMGSATPEAGAYKGVAGFANLTGNFKMAKNIITVGAVDKKKQVLERSSKGPAYDGRIKPELVAYAPAGTSDAAALVSGTVLLLQDLYQNKEIVLPDAALIKAVLVAGAEDVGRPQIDFSSGYGNLQAQRSMEIINSQNYYSGQLEPGGFIEFPMQVPAGIAELKVALSWNDPAANPGDAVALVHDLDMKLQDSRGKEWLPWILNSEPQIESIMQIATRGRDSLNPVELITIQDPESGNYIVKISAENLSGPQSFSVAYSVIPEDEMTWIFPTNEDALLIQEENILRWTESFSAESARLEYKMEGSDWQVLSDKIDPDAESFTWIPVESGKGKFRLIMGEEIFESENFAVAPEVVPQVLFNCDEQFMLGWNKINAADSYKVQALGEKYMEDVLTLQDTTALIDKSLFQSGIWAVVPVFDSVEGVQGRAIDVEQQGVLCHYQNFFALLEEKEGVRATLNLSNSPLVSQVKFLRENEGSQTEIGAFSAPFSVFGLVAEDKDLEPGDNLYSAVITLKDGTEIITESINIFIPGENTFEVYPNPVRAGENLNILSKGDNLEFDVFDMSGRKISEDHLIHYIDRIEIKINSRGLYIIRASRDGKKIGAAKIIVQ